jgi:hypothetical protein
VDCVVLRREVVVVMRTAAAARSSVNIKGEWDEALT